MNLQTAVKTCLTQKYVTFSGRASRSEYWWFVLAVFIGSIVASIFGPLATLFSIAVFLPLLSAGYRRLQDTGRPGWLILIFAAIGPVISLFVPEMPEGLTEEDIAAGNIPDPSLFILPGILGMIGLVMVLVFLWWLTRPSQPGPNTYGPNPHEVTP